MGISTIFLVRNGRSPSAYSKKVTLGKDSRTELEKVGVGISLPFQWKLLPPPCFCLCQVLNALVSQERTQCIWGSSWMLPHKQRAWETGVEVEAAGDMDKAQMCLGLTWFTGINRSWKKPKLWIFCLESFAGSPEINNTFLWRFQNKTLNKTEGASNFPCYWPGYELPIELDVEKDATSLFKPLESLPS